MPSAHNAVPPVGASKMAPMNGGDDGGWKLMPPQFRLPWTVVYSSLAHGAFVLGTQSRRFDFVRSASPPSELVSVMSCASRGGLLDSLSA
jgi:hypothetical protein